MGLESAILKRKLNKSPTEISEPQECGVEPQEGEVEPGEGEVEPKEGEVKPEECEVEPEDGEVDYASLTKLILDITFSRVRQRLTEQQEHLPSPAIEVP